MELVVGGRKRAGAALHARSGARVPCSIARPDFDYRVDQGAFFQVNRWLVDELVECVTDERHGGLAWDLFAGVGLFARQLAEHFGA